MNLKKNSKMELRIALNRIPSEVIALCPKSRLKWFQMKKLQVRCYCLTSEEISRLSGKSPNVPDSNSSNVKIEMNDSHEVVDQLPLVQLQSVSESLTNDINDNDVEFLSASQNSEDTSKESCSSKQVFIGSSPELDVFAEKWESESEHEDSSEVIIIVFVLNMLGSEILINFRLQHQLDQPYGNQNDSPFHDISFESKLECNSESEHGDSSKVRIHHGFDARKFQF